MTLIIAGFGLTVLDFFNTVRIDQKVSFPGHYVTIYNAFFLIMLILQTVLLVWGLVVGFRLRRDINNKFKPSAPAA